MSVPKITRFADVEELLAAVNAPCALADSFRSSITQGRGFTGTDSLAEAVALARKGWQGGTAEIERLRIEIDRSLSGLIPMLEPFYDVTGDMIDVGRFVTGEPEDFLTLVDNGLRHESPSPRIVHIVCNIAVSGSISQDVIMRRGAAMVVLIDTLERHGIRCRVDLVDVTADKRQGGDQFEVYMTVKHDGESVSIDKLAYFLAHASAMRRLLFAVYEHFPDPIRRQFGIGRDMQGAYGFPGIASEQGTIYIDRIISAVDWSEQFTLAWLKAQLRKQGIAIEEETK